MITRRSPPGFPMPTRACVGPDRSCRSRSSLPNFSNSCSPRMAKAIASPSAAPRLMALDNTFRWNKVQSISDESSFRQSLAAKASVGNCASNSAHTRFTQLARAPSPCACTETIQSRCSCTPASVSLRSNQGQPRKCSLCSSGLTLPSSGLAFGQPLKSNVRALASSMKNDLSPQSRAVRLRRTAERPKFHNSKDGLLRSWRHWPALECRPCRRTSKLRFVIGASMRQPRQSSKSFRPSAMPSTLQGRASLPAAKAKPQMQMPRAALRAGKFGGVQVQIHERPNPSFKRTRLRRSA